MKNYILATFCALLATNIAVANQTFWDLLDQKRVDEALVLLKTDPSVDVDFLPTPDAKSAASMASEAQADELLAAIWARKFEGHRFSRDRMWRHAKGKSVTAAYAEYKTGLESDERGMRFLHWLAYQGNLFLLTKYVNCLLDRERLNTAVDVVGDPIIFSAIYGENEITKGVDSANRDVVRFLVENGARVDERGEYGRTALILSARWGLARMATLLIKLKASVNARDNGGETALLHAAREGHEAIAKTLLAVDADPSISGRHGTTALIEAVRNGHPRIVTLLLDAGANVDQADAAGNTALHYVGMRYAGLAQMLIERGANVNARNALGETPLHTAARAGHFQIVTVLVERGADQNAEDNDGNTAAKNAPSKKILSVLTLKRSKKRGEPPAAVAIVDDRTQKRLATEPDVVIEAVVEEAEPVNVANDDNIDAVAWQQLNEIADIMGAQALAALHFGIRVSQNL